VEGLAGLFIVGWRGRWSRFDQVGEGRERKRAEGRERGKGRGGERKAKGERRKLDEGG